MSRAASAPTPTRIRIDSTSPSCSMASPKATRLAVTTRTGSELRPAKMLIRSVSLAQPLQHDRCPEPQENPAQQARHIAGAHAQRSADRIVAREPQAERRNADEHQAGEHVLAREDAECRDGFGVVGCMSVGRSRSSLPLTRRLFEVFPVARMERSEIRERCYRLIEVPAFRCAPCGLQTVPPEGGRERCGTDLAVPTMRPRLTSEQCE